MDETIKMHLDAISEKLKGTKHSFLFLMADGDHQHAVKNCTPEDQAVLMINYIERIPDIDTAFSNCVFQLQAAEADGQKPTFQDRLSEKLNETKGNE